MNLSREEMKKEVSRLYKIIYDCMGLMYTQENELGIFFQEAFDNLLPGTYVFANEKGYHLAEVGDRGGINQDFVSENFDEYLLSDMLESCLIFVYRICKITQRLAQNYVCKKIRIIKMC